MPSTSARNTRSRVSHCTGALHLSLWALGIGPGDEVITTPFTFTATAEVLGYLGARPVFVDVDPGTFNINPARIEEALESGANRRVRAILPVHFAGHACDMDRILNIARSYNLKVVEDAAHAAGSARHMDGRGMAKIGTIGDLTCFSFYATKNFTTAEGGMITTGDDALAEKIAVASLHGMNKDAWKRYDKSGSWYYEIHDRGSSTTCPTCTPPSAWRSSSAPTTSCAARGRDRARLQRRFPRRRRAAARVLSNPASSTPGISTCCASARSACRIGRNQFVEILRERGVGCSVHCIPLHTMHYYQRTYGYRDGDFPVTEDIFSRCLSLPIYAAMTDDDVAYVIETVLAIARENRR